MISKPFFSNTFITLYLGDCREILSFLDKFDLLLTDPPYDMESLPDCLWNLAPSAYIFGDKRRVAETWFRQVPYPNKDILAWHYKNSPKPRGRWRMSMQSIIYGWQDGQPFNQDAARTEYTPSAKKLNGRIRPSNGRMSTSMPYDTSKGSLPKDVIEWPALLGHLSKERVGHRDQKPLGLIKRLVATIPGVKTIIDPFAGSGTTAAAAMELGIKCTLIEIQESNCEMIVKRLAGSKNSAPTSVSHAQQKETLNPGNKNEKAL